MKKIFKYSFPIFLLLINCCNISSTNDKENIVHKEDFTKIKFEQSLDEIKFNAATDDPEIKICNKLVYQYFDVGRFEYRGGKPKLIEEILGYYDSVNVAQESGLIRIRFIVNCEGKANRFRLLGMDNNYQEKIFENSITDQLLEIVKRLDGWIIQSDRGVPIDYYQYLIFKIKDGKINKILP